MLMETGYLQDDAAADVCKVIRLAVTLMELCATEQAQNWRGRIGAGGGGKQPTPCDLRKHALQRQAKTIIDRTKGVLQKVQMQFLFRSKLSSSVVQKS